MKFQIKRFALADGVVDCWQAASDWRCQVAARSATGVLGFSRVLTDVCPSDIADKYRGCLDYLMIVIVLA